MTTWIYPPVRLTFLLLALLAPLVHAHPLRELAEFAGVRDNPLVGYGLVVGLDGTGDQTMQAPFTGQSLTNMLSQMGISVPPGTNMQLRNVAAVMVTANLPPFAGPGQRLDVVVSSIGNARSLRGGTLLMTPLRGIDGETYAIAQGNLVVGGAGAQSGGSSAQINHLAGARISGGAQVERQVPFRLDGNDGILDLHLKEADFTTAQRAVDAINRHFGYTVAVAVDSRVIRLHGPPDGAGMVGFLAQVENIRVSPQQSLPKVVVNARTGSVVLSGPVSLQPAAVAHGNLSVVIDTYFDVIQPAPFGMGETVVIPDSDIRIEQQAGSLQRVAGVDLMDVVGALNALGATPQDLISILEALKASGALRADLEIL